MACVAGMLLGSVDAGWIDALQTLAAAPPVAHGAMTALQYAGGAFIVPIVRRGPILSHRTPPGGSRWLSFTLIRRGGDDPAQHDV